MWTIKSKRWVPVSIAFAAIMVLFLVFCIGQGMEDDILFLQPIKVMAAEIGSIQVNYFCNNGEEPVSGAEFSCVRIAEAAIDGNSISWRMLEPYDRAGYDPNSSEYGTDTGMAEKYRKLYQKYNDGTAVEKITSSGGICRFGNCVPGLYLVWQSGSQESAENYETSMPLVVAVPEYDAGKLVYTKAIYPKTVKKQVTQEAPEEPEILKKIREVIKPAAPQSETMPSKEAGVQPEPAVTAAEEELDAQPIAGIQPEADDPGTGRKGGATGDDSQMLLWFGIAAAAAAGTAGYLIYRKFRL